MVLAHIGPACVPQGLAFRMMDRHGYGELSITMMERSFVQLGIEVPEDFDAIFEAIDLNRDGYISYLAFLASLLPQEYLQDGNLCKVAFGILDRGGDSYIDGFDLAAVYGHRHDSEICQRVIMEVCPEGRLSWSQFAQLAGCPE